MKSRSTHGNRRRADRRIAASVTGYSLVEILVVLVISLILITVAFPRLRPGLVRAKVNSAANVVASDLQYAQVLAVRRRRPVALIVAASTRQYVIRDRETGDTLRTRNLGQDTEYGIEVLTASPSSNEMFPNGLARTTMELTLTLQDYSRTVKLTRAGQVRVVRP
ncbi:MAG: GspH/FimT family pseudopilin [Gemmatimonadales bacterium]